MRSLPMDPEYISVNRFKCRIYSDSLQIISNRCRALKHFCPVSSHVGLDLNICRLCCKKYIYLDIFGSFSWCHTPYVKGSSNLPCFIKRRKTVFKHPETINCQAANIFLPDKHYLKKKGRDEVNISIQRLVYNIELYSIICILEETV